MRLLCDEHVAQSYVDALSAESWSDVARVVDVLGSGTADVRISQYARKHGYVVLTRDVDFFANDPNHGIVFYPPHSNPPVGDFVQAVQQIGDVYNQHSNIRESLSGWI